MSSKVPIISVTPHNHHSSSSSESDSDSDSSGSNDMDYSKNWGGATDVEDFDSQADAVKPTIRKSPAKKSLGVPSQEQNDITDVEDYCTDSESEVGDGIRSPAYPELLFSLQDFLQHTSEESTAVSNGEQEKVEHRTGNFLQAQNLNNFTDYLTDCEDYNTDTDSELENGCAKSVCIDITDALVEQGRVNISDATVIAKASDVSDEDCEDVSVVSDVSDIGNDNGHLAKGLSEDELLELSGDEEICQIAFSDSDSNAEDGNASEEDMLSSACGVPLDVTFVTPMRSSQMQSTTSDLSAVTKTSTRKLFLDVGASAKDEVLTDVEHLDVDDEDSFDDDEKPIPQAVILAPGDDGGCLTDCEDVFCDELSESSVSDVPPETIDISVIPQPQREVILLQEDKFGDTITSVMPMEDEYQFGINSTVRQECHTDSEEYSCADDEGSNYSIADVLLPQPSDMMEGEITISNELMKPHHSKRLEIQSNAEPITDVEEFFMDGTNSRKKKLKTRSMSKGKSKELEISKGYVDGGTDIEDIYVSDSGQPDTIKAVPNLEQSSNTSVMCADKATDVEDLSNDDISISSVSEAELPPIDAKTSNLKDYHANSANVVVALETCASASCSKHKKTPPSTHFRKSVNQSNQQQQTDDEDVQLPSDTEELFAAEPATACLCNELTEMLNESCTTVHEKCSNRFNDDAEKQHMKGMPREALTDIEYVESDESAARGSK